MIQGSSGPTERKKTSKGRSQSRLGPRGQKDRVEIQISGPEISGTRRSTRGRVRRWCQEGLREALKTILALNNVKA